ncbi:MAG TPA: hypothetical protein VFC15_04365 [Candidatus Limnocylindrales bacterium]|nr:hypothetical protein [Candidatus Limnocylindrales bacterium]
MSGQQDLRSLLRFRPLQLLGLAAFLAAIGGMSFYTKLCVIDNDIWWHLKVGDWMVEHLAVPHTGILSRTAATRPWVAYSWGYEVLMSLVYKWFGLMGIGLYGTLITILVAYAVYWMLRRISGRFWVALVLAALTCWAFLFNGMPRPVFFSIALFCVTLALLLEANRTGRVELLYWLPLIFWVWGNLHIQFIYGLFLIGLLVGTTLAQRIADSWGIAPSFLVPATLPSLPLLGVFASCLLATLIGPNFYHPYIAVYEYSKAKFAYNVIIELQPLSFRGSSHYVQLLLTACGFFAVGWRKKIDLFKLAMMTACSLVAYRTMRDAWFVAIPAAACIADFPAAEAECDAAENWMENLGVAAAVVVLLLVISRGTDFTSRDLDRAISSEYPVNAVNFLRRNPQPGPLYNNLGWGGFLMWYMPDYPVAIDGRNDLYGDELDQLFYASQSAEAGYTTDPYLNEAGVVVLAADLPLAKILTADPRFKLIYQDSLAVVFGRQ